MPIRHQSRLLTTLLWFVLLLIVEACAAPEPLTPPVKALPQSRDPIKVGVTTSLTGSLADFGTLQRNGMKMWADDINDRGALLGRPVQLVVYDDGSDAANVKRLYEKLITQDKVDFLISPYSSNLTLAAAPIAEKYGVSMVTVASSSDIWKHGYQYTFGLYTPASENMDPVLNLAQQHQLKTVALIYLDEDFPRDLAAGVRVRAPEHGLSIVLDQQYSNDLTAMPALAARVAAANPDVVIVGSYMDDAVAFAKASKPAGVKPKLMAFSGAAALQEFMSKVGVANVQGMLSTVQWTRGIRVPGGFDMAFRYERLHREYPTYDVTGGYSAGQVLEAAVRLAGTVDKKAVRDQLATLKFRSILGNYRVDGAGLQTAKSTYLVQCQEDHFSLVYPSDVARYPLVYPYPG
jgi:branched-chain amino acid transport system substrate-binding protein